MYWAIDFVANGWTYAFFLHWPRPVFYETLLFAGHFGFEGSLIFLALIVVFDLALALFLLERYVLRARIPWWLAFATLLLAMAGPGFYAQPAYDVGYHLALLFGLLGMWAWEARTPRTKLVAFAVAGACFALSTLANEGFAPALVAYGAWAAYRLRHAPLKAGAVFCLPLVAMAISFADGQLTHSPFIAMHAAANYPYRVDLSPDSLRICTLFYVSSLMNWGFLALMLACIAGLWLNKRLAMGAFIFITAIALYAPYVLLPNHLEPLYDWPPLPLLTLLVPLAWPTQQPRLVPRVALAASVVFAIAFLTTQYAGPKAATRVALEQSRHVMAALRAHKAEIARAHHILVRGITFVSDPWLHNALALSPELGFNGDWAIETEPNTPAAAPQRNAQPIASSAIDYRNYDLVLVFNTDGSMAQAFRPKQVAASR